MIVSVFEAFKASIQKVLDNFRIFILLGLVLVSIIVAALFTFASVNIAFSPIKKFSTFARSTITKNEILVFLKSIPAYPWHTWLIVSISLVLLFLVCFGILAGYIKASLQLYDTNRTSVRTIFSCFHLGFRFTIASLIYFLVGLLGMILIVPGIFWFVRFSLFEFFMIDKNQSILDSFSSSYDATKTHFWPLFTVWFIQAIMIYTMDIPQLLKLFVIMPIFLLTFIYFYRHLATQQS